jgi:phosphoglycolate phosphatase-like HAD superfamily hydrolase
VEPGPDVWFMGDGKSDIQCGKGAGVGTVLYNFANYTRQELDGMFTPETAPDAVVADYSAFRRLVEQA